MISPRAHFRLDESRAFPVGSIQAPGQKARKRLRSEVAIVDRWPSTTFG
jgi:hypothetical protein